MLQDLRPLTEKPNDLRNPGALMLHMAHNLPDGVAHHAVALSQDSKLSISCLALLNSIVALNLLYVLRVVVVNDLLGRRHGWCYARSCLWRLLQCFHRQLLCTVPTVSCSGLLG